jgi:hypothetical protein
LVQSSDKSLRRPGAALVWYGSPQHQIQAFRRFQIAAALIDAQGYPELTPSLKQKVFGLNGARVYGIDVPERRRKTEADPIGTRRRAYRKIADPTLETYGPKTDTEYDAGRRARRSPSLKFADVPFSELGMTY